MANKKIMITINKVDKSQRIVTFEDVQVGFSCGDVSSAFWRSLWPWNGHGSSKQKFHVEIRS